MKGVKTFLAMLTLAIGAAAGAPAAWAVQTRLTLIAYSPTITYGTNVVVRAELQYSGGTCPQGLQPPLQGRVALEIDGVPQGEFPFYTALYRECSNGQYSASANLWGPKVGIGEHVVTARYLGEPGFETSAAAPLTVPVVPDFTAHAPGGLGTIGIGFSPAYTGLDSYPGLYCSPDPVGVSVTATPQPPGQEPPAVSFPYGFVNYRLACRIECESLCPPPPATRTIQRVQVEYPGELPPSAEVWLYSPTNDSPTPPWTRVPATIRGRTMTLDVTGGIIGNVASPDHYMRGSLAVSIPQAVPADPALQDMWWGGEEETGWGVSMVQRGERMFVSLFVYDGDGTPMWLLMPAGSWDPTRTVLSGTLHRPASPTAMGAAVGSATLTFDASGRGTLAYNIMGASGSKSLQRMPFGTGSGKASAETGVWDLTATGSGGIAIHRSGDSLFASWMTFDPAGPETWLVMPGGTWAASDTYEGALYRTRGSPWVGTAYDPKRLRVQAAGSLRIRFTGPDSAEISYVVDGVAGTATLARHPF